MATYWENSCSFGLRYVSWYKYLIVSLVFSHLGFWSGNLFLIAPFPDLCLLVSLYYGRLTLYADTTSLYDVTTTLYYGLLSLYATSSLYGSITSLYAQTSLYDVTTTLYDVYDFARRRFTLTPFRELLYTCRDYRTYC